MANILAYDDSEHRRESLKALISFSTELSWVGGFANCNNILKDIETLKPDLILMDIEMPEVDGLQGLKLARQHYPFVKVIMQTAFDNDDKVFASIKAGAEGYILKSASSLQIIQSIDEVLKGGASMTPSIALKVMRFFNTEPAIKNYDLTPKEKEVLEQLADGLSYKMIADKLGISYFTVNNHVKKIYEKLQVHSMGEAVAKAHRDKLV